MQVCTLLQTDNHTSTPLLCFYRPDTLPAIQPTASRHWRQFLVLINFYIARPAYCLILMYRCGLTVVIKWICYVLGKSVCPLPWGVIPKLWCIRIFYGLYFTVSPLHCFDCIDWVAGRASCLSKQGEHFSGFVKFPTLPGMTTHFKHVFLSVLGVKRTTVAH